MVGKGLSRLLCLLLKREQEATISQIESGRKEKGILSKAVSITQSQRESPVFFHLPPPVAFLHAGFLFLPDEKRDAVYIFCQSLCIFAFFFAARGCIFDKRDFLFYHIHLLWTCFRPAAAACRCSAPPGTCPSPGRGRRRRRRRRTKRGSSWGSRHI